MENIPELIFIVPYRNRKAHLNCFLQTMKYLLEDLKDIKFEIVISEQGDDREFNRGAMKNMGFMYIKNKYPKNYKNMTFVFNDVDTFPGVKGIVNHFNINDIDKQNNIKVKHFYGFDFALGGVFSVKGDVFEYVNGFPNYWGWGFEDNCLQKRLSKKNYKVDRTNFYILNHDDWINFFHGIKRKIDSDILRKFSNDNFKNGLNSIKCNMKHIKEEYLDANIKAYNIIFKNWNIPEDMNNISFEINNNPTRIFAKKNTLF